jgi:hypothetical protein
VPRSQLRTRTATYWARLSPIGSAIRSDSGARWSSVAARSAQDTDSPASRLLVRQAFAKPRVPQCQKPSKWPLAGRRTISIHAKGKPSRKISTITKASISHAVSTPSLVSVDAIRSSPPSTRNT